MPVIKTLYAAVVAATIFTVGAISARAQSGSGELALDAYFNSVRSCYGRVYSAEHLRKHPQQQVRQIAISHFPNRQELLGMDSPFQPYPDTPRIVLNLSVLVRGEVDFHQSGIWSQQAICDPAGARLHCRFECDGGDFYVAEAKDGILITGGSDLYFTQCDPGDRILKRKPDDTSFKLSPLPFSHCNPQ